MEAYPEVLMQIGSLASRALSRGELTKQQRLDIIRDIERLAKAHAAPVAAPVDTLTDELRSELKAMSEETGWAEVGGHIIRDPVTNDVVARTQWIPNAPWWPGRPKGLTEKESLAAINKALAGETLRTAERRLIDYMIYCAKHREAEDAA